MTSQVAYTDVRLRKCFPYFKDLPHETKLDYNYHGKKLHWLLLAEVVADISLVRPGFVLRDKSGATFSIHFYPERTEQLTNFAKKIKKGSTLAILYAENHQFMDGQVGIRVEDLRNVKLIRAPLKEILTFNDMLQDLQKVQKPSCSACKTVDAKLQCAGCNLLHYCNQVCITTSPATCTKNHRSARPKAGRTKVTVFIASDWQKIQMS